MACRYSVFRFKENVPEEDITYTKRIFLKKIATHFDPIVFLTPYTIGAKMLLQDMWTAGINCFDVLTEPPSSSARVWFAELPQLQKIQVPRCLRKEGTVADGYTALNTLEIWPRLLWGEHLLYISARMTSFFNIH